MSVDVTKGYTQRLATCILKTDHPQFKDWSYSIQFTSFPFVMADPRDLNLGSFTVDGKSPNAVQKAALDVFADSKIELTRDDFTVPEEIELTITSLSSEVRQLQRNVWTTRYQVTIGLSAKGREAVLHNAQPGLITKAIQIAAGEPRSRRWQYSVYWQTLAPLESQPSHLSFANLMDEGDDHCSSITISSTTDEKFRIISVTNQSQGIQIESTVDTADDAPQHRLKFKARELNDTKGRSTGGPRRFFSGRIQVRTTHKLRPVVEIPWSAMLDPSVTIHSNADHPKSSSEPRP
jgi:hypothetical protein